MLTFYFSPGSSSMAPHIALHEVGAEFEPRLISLTQNERHTPEFLALNPDGKVPLLLIDGRPLTEVAGILFYLAKRFPDARLLPDDMEAEAQTVSWMSYIASTIHPARRQGAEASKAAWQVAEKRLGRPDWVLGRYSIADIHLFRLYWRFGHSIHAETGSLKNLEAHYERMMNRPAVRRTIEVESTIGYQLRP
jgi:glutathione S-transferase